MDRIEQPEWAKYWLSFLIRTRQIFVCRICGKMIEAGYVSLIKNDDHYCYDCADQIYKRIRQDLEPAEQLLITMAQAYGHRLREFRPVISGEKGFGVFTAICATCNCTVSYFVVDILRDIEKAHRHPRIIDVSRSDILIRRCTGYMHT